MRCLVALLALLAPRVTIILLVLLSDYIGSAYQTILWPVLGFIFAPFTTLAYAFAINANGSVTGLYLVLVIVAVLLDLGALGGGESARRTRVVRVERR